MAKQHKAFDNITMAKNGSQTTIYESIPTNSSQDSLRYLCIGDPHFREQHLARCEEMMNAIIKLAEDLAEKNLIDEIVNLGDTYHTFKIVNQYCQRLAIRFFRRLASIRPLKVLVGNHDRPSHNEFLTQEHPFHGLENHPRIRIVWTSYAEWRDEIDGYIIWMPYVQKGLHDRALDHITYLSVPSMPATTQAVRLDIYHEDQEKQPTQQPPRSGEIGCEFSHGEYRGAIMEGHVSKTGDVWGPEKWPNVSGHIHDHQYIGSAVTVGDQTRISGVVYVGTPIQVAMNEAEDKSVSLITVPRARHHGKRVIYEKRIPLMCTVTKTIVLSYDEMIEWEPSDQRPDIHGRDIHWHLIIQDVATKFSGLSVVPHYDRLQSLGITIQTKPIALHSRTISLSEVVPLKEIDSRVLNGVETRELGYLAGLYKRLENNNLLITLLQRICETSISHK